MPGFLGGDTVMMRQHGEAMRTAAHHLDDRLRSLKVRCAAVTWSGPDADAFRGEVRDMISAGSAVMTEVLGAADRLVEQAQDQDGTSSPVAGLGIFAPFDPSGPSGPVTPMALTAAQHARLSDLLDAATSFDLGDLFTGNSADLQALRDELESLTPADRREYLASLSDAELDALAAALAKDGSGFFGTGGNTPQSRRALLDTLLRDADPADVERLAERFDSLTPDARGGGDAAAGTYDLEPDGTWTPPGEVVPDDASWRDIDQGAYGNCVSMATLGMVMDQDDGWAAEHVEDNGNGTVTVTLYDENGNPEPITMPKDLPTQDGNPVHAGNDLLAQDPNAATWPAYVERALAIQMGGEYGAFEGLGSPDIGPRLTGMDIETVPPSDADDAFDAARNGESMIIGTAVPPPNASHPQGWVGGHGFWVEGTSTNDQGEEVLVCRNPWGSDTETMTLTREQYEQWTSSAEIHHD